MSINYATKLSGVQADYIYLDSGRYSFCDRRPYSGNFKPGEFAALFQQALDTLDLIFVDGIDWQAFFASFQKLRQQYNDADLTIQAIEKKSGGSFVVRLEVPEEADKAAIEQSAKANYEQQLQLVEARYQAQLQAKDAEIESHKRESTNMLEITRLLASKPITVEAKAISSSDQFNNNFDGATIGNVANKLSGNASQNATQNISPATRSEDIELAEDAKTILFLASNPKQTGRLRLDEELREIDESLRRAERRNQFDLKNKGAVRTRDFSRALLDNNPKIVHFSGHGVGTAAPEAARSDSRDISLSSESEVEISKGLLFEDETGYAKLIDSEQLADVFELFADQVECVVLNACYSKAQADAIAQHIPYVIGMSRPISDKGAIEFAIAFYDAIGAGRDIEFAFKLACTQLIPSGEKDIPKLLKRLDKGE